MNEEFNYCVNHFDLTRFNEAKQFQIECIVSETHNTLKLIQQKVPLSIKDKCSFIWKYQKLRRLDKQQFNALYKSIDLDKLIETIKEVIDTYVSSEDIKQYDMRNVVKDELNTLNEDIKILKQCWMLKYLINDEPISPDLYKVCGWNENEETPDASAIADNIVTHIINNARIDFMSAFMNIESFGLILAYMHEFKIDGVTQEDWDMYWEAVELMNNKVLFPILPDMLIPVLMDVLDTKLYNKHPILEHVSVSLYTPLIHILYDQTKSLNRISDSIVDSDKPRDFMDSDESLGD